MRPFLFAALGLCAGFYSSFVRASVIGVDPSAPAQNVSIWDSTILPSSGVIPIGGSGQVNGGFIVDTGNAPMMDFPFEIGLRAQKRFAGPVWPRTGNVFTVDPGTSSPGRATWNYDLHVDLGTNGLQSSLRGNGRNYLVTLDIDSDPTSGILFSELDINTLIAPGITNWSFFQASINPTFGLVGIPGFNLAATQGIYDFRLRVFNGDLGVDLITYVQVVVGSNDVGVPEPASLALMGVGLGGLAAASRRRRR